MFNTVSLPANIDLEKYSENYPQASPRSSKNFYESSSSNTPSVYNSNTRESVSEIFSFPAASNISSARTSMNGNVQQNQYDTSDIYNEYQNINPVPNLTSSNAQVTQVQDSWDLLNLIPVTTTNNNNTNVSGQQNRESVNSFQGTGFSPRSSFTNPVNVSESITKASIKILKIMVKFKEVHSLIL